MVLSESALEALQRAHCRSSPLKVPWAAGNYWIQARAKGYDNHAAPAEYKESISSRAILLCDCCSDLDFLHEHWSFSGTGGTCFGPLSRPECSHPQSRDGSRRNA